jgi:hypothetical protein
MLIMLWCTSREKQIFSPKILVACICFWGPHKLVKTIGDNEALPATSRTYKYHTNPFTNHHSFHHYTFHSPHYFGCFLTSTLYGPTSDSHFQAYGSTSHSHFCLATHLLLVNEYFWPGTQYWHLLWFELWSYVLMIRGDSSVSGFQLCFMTFFGIQIFSGTLKNHNFFIRNVAEKLTST